MKNQGSKIIWWIQIEYNTRMKIDKLIIFIWVASFSTPFFPFFFKEEAFYKLECKLIRIIQQLNY